MRRIALILENITWSFDAALAEALGTVCMASSIQLILYESRYGTLAHLTETLAGHDVQGVVFLADSISLADSTDNMQAFLGSLKVPCVTVGLRFPGFPSVAADNSAGMTLLMHHLFERGARRIAHVTGPSLNREASERKDAYLAAMREFDLPVSPDWIIEGIFSPISGYNSTQTLLPLIRSREIDAIAFANDEAASGCLRLLESEGIAVPDDILVSGYGDTQLGLMTHPPLTTVSNNPEALAELALRTLLGVPGQDRDDNFPTGTRRICPLLRPNASTGCSQRNADRVSLLKKHPLAHLHHPEFFSDTRNPEIFWAELTAKLHSYLVPSFFVVQFETASGNGSSDNVFRQGTLLYGTCDETALLPGQRVSLPALLPEGILYRNNEPLIYKALQFGETFFGYLLTSLSAANTMYLEDICRHCMIWLEADLRMQAQAHVEQKMSDTMTQLSMTNRQLNEFRVRSNLDGTAPGMDGHASVLKQEQTKYIILLLDIDGLRHINQRHGYAEGDRVLEQVETALRNCIREQDRVMRQGGDSFMLLVKQTGLDMVELLQERLIAQLDRLNRLHDKGYRIDFTWGYACGTAWDAFDSVIRKADEMLYRKKRERLSFIPDA